MAIVRTQNRRSVPVRGWDLADAGNFSNFFGEFDRLFSDMASPLLSQSQAANAYPADLYETGENVVLEMAVPGIKAEDLDISIEGRQLAIRGTLPNFSDNEERRYWLASIPRGEFSRSVTLPATVETDNVQAQVQDGLLTLTMPKVAQAKARKIEITSG